MIKEYKNDIVISDETDMECPANPENKYMTLEKCHRLTFSLPIINSIQLINCSELKFPDLKSKTLTIKHCSNLDFTTSSISHGIEMENNKNINFGKSLITFDMRLWGCKDIQLADYTFIEDYLTLLDYEDEDENEKYRQTFSENIILPKDCLYVGKELAGKWKDDSPPLENYCTTFFYGERMESGNQTYFSAHDRDFFENKFGTVYLLTDFYMDNLPHQPYTTNKYDLLEGKQIEYNKKHYSSFLQLNDEIIKLHGYFPEDNDPLKHYPYF